MKVVFWFCLYGDRTMKRTIWLMALALILIGCDVPSDTFQSVPLAPTPTGAPILLEESSCDSLDFDHNPDIEERMAFSLKEPTRLRGVIYISSGASVEPIIRLENSQYTLRGMDFSDDLHHRIIEVLGNVSSENDGVFWVEAYEVIPYAVLTGQLRIREYVCRESCNDWLLFDVEQNGKTYTYALSHYSNLYPKLWDQAGSQVSLAVDIYDGQDYMHYYILKPRFLCK
jgi:hypothetical protein